MQLQTVAAALLPGSRLEVELRSDGTADLLQVRSTVDRSQALLLPLDQLLLGLALRTDLGRVHALPWALAWGAGTVPDRCVVHFSTDTLRMRREHDVRPVRLGDRCWVADAVGVFASAALVTCDVETARVRLCTRW